MDSKSGEAVPILSSFSLHLGRDQVGKEFKVDANVIATGRTCVIGASGSGKSYAVSVICEELCKCGVPFAIVDTEGEHSGLKQKFDVLVIGDDGECDIRWEGLDLEQLGTQAPDLAPLILDLSEAVDPKGKVSELLSHIYAEVERRRTPYLIVVEEADRFVPQNGERLAIFGEIARRGRKRGVGLMVCTQRPSMVDKNILSQCGNQFIGKLVIRNDLMAVAQFFQGRETPKQLTTLKPGSFYAMGGLSPTPALVAVRAKETQYGGSTPKLATRVIKPFTQRGQPQTSSPATANGTKGGVAGKGTLALGMAPAFSEEDLPSLVKRDKSYIFFGKEEAIAGATLYLRPMVELAVVAETGLLRKRLEERYLVLDGLTGRFVDLGDSPVMYEGFERLIDLTEQEIEILRAMDRGRDMGALEISNKVGFSKEMLRRPMRSLERDRLVRSVQVGRSRLYRRVYDLPVLRWRDAELALENFATSAKADRSILTEKKVREVVRGLIDHAEVHGYREFVYPLYRVELVSGRRKKRIVWLDGRTGLEAKA